MTQSGHECTGAGTNARLWVSIAALLALTTAIVLAAAPGPSCPIDKGIGDKDTVVARLDVRGRTQWLRTHIEYGGHKALQWTLGWGISLSLLSIGQFTIAPFADAESRPDYLVGGTASAIGALTRFIVRPKVMPARRKLRKSKAQLGSCEALAEAERALVKAAKSERFLGRPFQNIGVLVFNAGVGLTLGLGFKRPLQGIRIATTGMVIGNVMLLTRPKKMVPSLDAYRRGHIESTPLILPGGGGASLAGRF